MPVPVPRLQLRTGELSKPTIALSEAHVKALRPRASAYDLRDAKLRAFGVRVLPSGARRFFIHIQHRGQRVWKIIGDAGVLSVDEARARATSVLAAIRCDADAPVSQEATRFDAVAEASCATSSRTRAAEPPAPGEALVAKGRRKTERTTATLTPAREIPRASAVP